ncbi:MAG: DUF6263 family protein [Flavitalea sp.]
MKQWIWIALGGFTLAGCSDKEDQITSLTFDPAGSVNYSFKVSTVTTEQASWGPLTDTLSLNFSLRTLEKDTSGDKLLFRIDKLEIGRDSFNYSKGVTINNVRQDMKAFYNRTDSIADAMTGDSLKIILDRNGALVRMEGYDSLAKRVAQKMACTPSEVKNTLSDYISETAIRDVFLRLFCYLPSGMLIKNGSWVNNTVYKSLAPIKSSNMITIDSVMKNEIVLDVRSEISAGTEGDYYLSGKGKTMIVADKRTGIPKSLKTVEKIEVKLSNGSRNQIKMIDVNVSSQDF